MEICTDYAQQTVAHFFYAREYAQEYARTIWDYARAFFVVVGLCAEYAQWTVSQFEVCTEYARDYARALLTMHGHFRLCGWGRTNAATNHRQQLPQ